MANVIKFRLVLRSSERTPSAEGEIIPFPFGRRRHIVERIARAMRAMTQQEAEDYLERELQRLCNELRSIGIDCEDCESLAVIELSDAIGKELHGPDFRLQVDGSL
ncbi:hypothetical protein SAMN05216330_102432 [Bradyrhizobium sp. Ghvi]|uniref:DUF6074 family protein n=1 Tax=Bradyrhizobium sp. Ghvi TaxID=1855319 RepID=UPI0008E71F9B|nr:DUF6074 family protein [Bradyrhizobium sp. Ghvi]SFO25699.1 hypothetical protein SAMN05216330_102432 [Bradyrhizobium sp. Ghvi]